GAFKNLLDWLVGSLEFPGKPVLLLNASARGSYHAQEALAEVLRTMSAELLSTQPFPVALPGAGCTTEQILVSTERCAELRVALGHLAAELACSAGATPPRPCIFAVLRPARPGASRPRSAREHQVRQVDPPHGRGPRHDRAV